jgi:hypothetical protein
MYSVSDAGRRCFSTEMIFVKLMTKLRRMRLAELVTRMWVKRNAYRLLVGKQEEKRPLGRQRRR